MSRLLYSPAARADLDGIWTYTVERWGASQAAAYLRALDGACKEAAAGLRVPIVIDDIRPGYRKLLVQSHVIFFRATGADAVEIVRILHQSMDVGRHLPNEPRE